MRPTKSSIFVICFVGLLTILQSCKDTTATHDEGVAETCRSLVDQKEWAPAISICKNVNTDEGRHLTAQSYLGRGGITLFSLMRDMANPANKPSSLLFSYAPDTTSDREDYKAALDIMMGSDMEIKTQTMYLETLLVSSMMVFKELKTLLSLDVSGDGLTTCAGASGDITNCYFSPGIALGPPVTLSFPGLGSGFYDALCEDSSSDTSALGYKEPSGVIEFNTVKVDKCTIQTNSVLYYNKLANENYAGTGITGLEVFNFYGQMDSGSNFSFVDGTADVKFCNNGGTPPPGIPVPDASPDLKLSDCEIMSYLLNPGL